MRWMWKWTAGDAVAFVIEIDMAYGSARAARKDSGRELQSAGLFLASLLPGGGSEVSIVLLGAFRGMGIGTRALKALTPRVEYDGGVFARIKSDNHASVKAFANAGYVVATAKDWERVSEGRRDVLVLRWNGRI